MKLEQDMRIESETFDEIRDSFDTVLQNLLVKMEESNSDEGTLDLKLTVNLFHRAIEQGERMGELVDIPTLKYKCQYTVPVKDGMDGTKDTGMELVWDKIDQRYVLSPVSLDGQMSIDDYMADKEEDEFGNIPEDIDDLYVGSEKDDEEFKKEAETAPGAERSCSDEGKEDIVGEEIKAPTGFNEATEQEPFDAEAMNDDYMDYEERGTEDFQEVGIDSDDFPSFEF